MAQYSFGSGFLYAIPGGSNPTPVQFGTLQEVTLDLSFTTKKLYGQNQYPVAIGRGPAAATASAKAASISSRAFNAIFAGLTDAVGGLLVVNNESGTITTGAVTVSNSATFAQDLGVTYVATGVQFQRVASAPTAGQYSVSAGVYTFNTSENATPVYINYSYTSNSVGRSATLVNQPMGSAPAFSAVLNVPYPTDGTVLTYRFYKAISTKLSLGFKNEDFTVPQFDMEFFADTSGNVYQASFST
jgi:hypothetical protein